MQPSRDGRHEIAQIPEYGSPAQVGGRDGEFGSRMKHMSWLSKPWLSMPWLSKPWLSMRSRRGGLFALLLSLFGSCGVLASSTSPAHAGKMYFGTQEYLRSIQDVAIKGPNDEELYLGYKYSFYSFILPYTLSDDGYVLGIKGREAYFPLDQASIDRFQGNGLLPTPLPPYQLSAVDYAMGHAAWSLPVLIAGSFAVGALRKRRRQSARPHFESALQCTRDGDLDGALAEYTKAIEIDPKFESALVNRGDIYQHRGDYDRAIADFTKAIKAGPEGITVLALISRGTAYEKKGDFDRAIADHSQAIKKSGAAGAYYNRGNAFAGRGDFARAIADYTKAIELEPNAAVAYQARGRAYDRQGNAAQARADYATAREIAGRQDAAAAAASQPTADLRATPAA